MAPAAPELLLLGLMHFALARLDIWHWKVLKMLLQNSGILRRAAFPLSTITCSWDGQSLQPEHHHKCVRQLGDAFHLHLGWFLLHSPLHID